MSGRPLDAVCTSQGPPSCSFKMKLAACIPLLRAVARLWRLDPGDADQLVEETLTAAFAQRAEASAEVDARLWLLRRQREIAQATEKQQRSRGTELRRCAPSSYPQGFWSGLQRLPRDLKEALFLHDGAGLSGSAIAAVQGCSLATASERVVLGRVSLLGRTGTTAAAPSADPEDKAPVLGSHEEPDFEVSRAAAARWRVRPRSAKARAYLAWTMSQARALDSGSDVLIDRDGANNLVLSFRKRGYAVDLIGPKGAVRL